MGESLHHLGGRELLLAEFVFHLLTRVADGVVTITPDHVVVRVQHDLARERFHWHVIDELELDGHDNEVARRRSLGSGCRDDGPSSSMSSVNVSGPRELEITTS